MPNSSGQADTERTVAAVDLGSNSFHLIVAERQGAAFRIVDRIRERVRLATGLTAGGGIQTGIQTTVAQRAEACLGRFAQRLRGFAPEDVRAVGTNTFRQVDDDGEFLSSCETILGHPIEIVSGDEEARLIYRGVAHDVSHVADEGPERRLVIDIGGGSTECIVGEGHDVLASASLYMGCVSFTRRFFGDGRLSKSAMSEARLAARLELEPLVRPFADLGWNVAIGSSGTNLAIRSMCVANDWSKGPVTHDGLRAVRKSIQSAKDDQHLEIDGLSDTRAPVVAGGVAILQAVFDAFDLDVMETSEAAIREGIVLGLLGDPRTEDSRDGSVSDLAARCGVDLEHARRVERTSLALFEHVRRAWFLDDPIDRRLLTWSASLHEAGMSVARAGYQRHSAYLVENADLPGFSRGDQRMLAAIVRGHRRKVLPELFASLPDDRARRALLLCVLLRIGRRLNRGRNPRPPLPANVEGFADGLMIRFTDDWLDDHPLTRYDLQEESKRLAEVGVELRLD